MVLAAVEIAVHCTSTDANVVGGANDGSGSRRAWVPTSRVPIVLVLHARL